MSQNDNYHVESKDETSHDDGNDEIPIKNLTDKKNITTDNDSHVCKPAAICDDADDIKDEQIAVDTETKEEEEEPNDAITDQNNEILSLSELLKKEQAKSSEYEQKLQLALADYHNLTKRTASEIDNRIMEKMRDVMTSLIDIREDFVRARDVFSKDNKDASGLDSILRNMDSVLAKYEVKSIDALGEIFDPNMHEAISTENDPNLDDGTIIREVRRGYTFKNTIIRPSLVVISKKE